MHNLPFAIRFSEQKRLVSAAVNLASLRLHFASNSVSAISRQNRLPVNLDVPEGEVHAVKDARLGFHMVRDQIVQAYAR